MYLPNIQTDFDI